MDQKYLPVFSDGVGIYYDKLIDLFLFFTLQHVQSNCQFPKQIVDRNMRIPIAIETTPQRR